MKEMDATFVGVSGPTMATNCEGTPTTTRTRRNGKPLTFGTLGPKLYAKGFPVIPLQAYCFVLTHFLLVLPGLVGTVREVIA